MDIDAREYFLARRPDSGPARPMYNRIAAAMRTRRGITMGQLCQMSEKELKKLRNIGDKGRAIVMMECRNYLNGNN